MLETVNYILGLKVIALQIVTLALLGLYLLKDRFPDLREAAGFVGRWGLWVGFFTALGASAVSLVHSTIFNLPPCPLCWWQRIFLYPQVFLFALALWKRDRGIADYSILLSVLGLGFALYHHALQMFPSSFAPCSAEGVSCVQILYLEFGYITYPLMAASAFAFLIVLMLFVRTRVVQF
ncbi:MAG: disulfide bond formation protein B [Candidatus Kaiserbacteria bacterium]|nr:MAG: disulfide bond formation protein B [Candidatus Kaiserbacteria bacterium]